MGALVWIPWPQTVRPAGCKIPWMWSVSVLPACCSWEPQDKKTLDRRRKRGPYTSWTMYQTWWGCHSVNPSPPPGRLWRHTSYTQDRCALVFLGGIPFGPRAWGDVWTTWGGGGIRSWFLRGGRRRPWGYDPCGVVVLMEKEEGHPHVVGNQGPRCHDAPEGVCAPWLRRKIRPRRTRPSQWLGGVGISDRFDDSQEGEEGQEILNKNGNVTHCVWEVSESHFCPN